MQIARLRFRDSVVRILCSVVFLLTPLSGTAAQETRNWWTVNNEREDTEKGKLQELLNRKRVYLNVTFTDTRPNSTLNNTERNDITQAVKESIAVLKDLKMVTYPEEAEFAVLVRASTNQGTGPNFSLLLDSEAEVSIDVIVVVPGTPLADGTRMPRIVWEASSPNAQVDARSAARFTVDGFLWELKKLRPRR